MKRPKPMNKKIIGHGKPYSKGGRVGQSKKS